MIGAKLFLPLILPNMFVVLGLCTVWRPESP